MDMKDRDIFRDSPLRYMGYANEVGEALRPLIPLNLVRLSYGLATAYVVADTCDKSYKVYQKTNRPKSTLIEGGDVLLWQMLASVIIPGYTINRVTWASSYAIKKLKMRSGPFKYIPTIISLSCIPFIVKPIDNLVDSFMDKTYRQYIGKS